MILHLVTDSARLSSIESSREACLLTQARFAVSAGIDVIQLREHWMTASALARLAAAIVSLTRGTSTRVVVNDRLDVAIATGADGVHLRSVSIAAARLRPQVPPGFLIGRSVHSLEEARDAGPVDYLLAGTVWSTSSKPADRALLEPGGLSTIAAATDIPVIGIGGVSLDRVGDLARTGAAGAAAIGAFLGADGPCRAVALETLTKSFRSAFDAARM
jgi:thiamine-phosphate pyrophosphorylase